MKDYLTDRKQFVQLGNTKSDYANVTCGVPQGSILGPLLFLIYVNDMQQALTHGTARLFADDTNITYCGKNLNVLKTQAEIDMTSLIDWFKVNKLALNVKKSNFLIIRSHYKRVPDDFVIKFGTEVLSRVTSTKYLGVIIDQFFRWNSHIESVCKKIAPTVGILCKIRHLVPFYILRQLYYSLIYPHLLYCIEAWGSTYPTHIKPLVLLQKKIIRIITFSPWQAHTSELFIATKILPLQKILFLSICVLVYSELCGDCQVKFNFNSRSHNHNTRNRSKLATSLRTSNYYCRSIEHTGAQFFNFIPDHLKNQLTVHRFKSKLKFWLFHEKFDIYKLIFPHKTETNSSSSL